MTRKSASQALQVTWWLTWLPAGRPAAGPERALQGGRVRGRLACREALEGGAEGGAGGPGRRAAVRRQDSTRDPLWDSAGGHSPLPQEPPHTQLPRQPLARTSLGRRRAARRVRRVRHHCEHAAQQVGRLTGGKGGGGFSWRGRLRCVKRRCLRETAMSWHECEIGEMSSRTARRAAGGAGVATGRCLPCVSRWAACTRAGPQPTPNQP
jgi:hypothetical protein